MKYYFDVAIGVIEVFLLIKLFKKSDNPVIIDDEQKQVLKGFGKKFLLIIILALLIIILMNHVNEIMSYIQNNIK